MGDRAFSRRRCGKPLLRSAEAAQRSRYLDVGRSRAFFEAHKLFGDGNECSDDRMGFEDAIPAVSGTIAASRLYPSGGGSQHGGVLALAFAPLWPGNVLEGCPLPRPGAEPNLC